MNKQNISHLAAVRSQKSSKQQTTRRTSSAFRDRQKEKGLVERSVWVPADQVDALKSYAASLVEKHIKKNQS